jgi:predicted GH43/DUF377 family glycosyl hydrolase
MIPEDDVMMHLPVLLKPDPKRTVIRPFVPADPPGFEIPGHPRAQRITDHVLSLNPVRFERALKRVIHQLSTRHRNVEALLARRFEEVCPLIDHEKVTSEQALLIGAYFSAEYSFEAAALFNPSVVLHPNQDDLPDGTVRIAMSLRGVGEGHVSSVCFRTGTWTPGGEIAINPPSCYAVPPVVDMPEGEGDGAMIRLRCLESQEASESILFPILPSQRQGIEDVRLVRFVEEDGSVTYYGTYTAFSGVATQQEMFRVGDFRSFELRPVTGVLAHGKGMALFPRRINGRYWCLGRQDNENIWLMVSDDLYYWQEGIKLITPKKSWEFVQMGNCGSPIEIEEGWLVLTHGVGMARNYCIGVCLLDKDDPSKVIGRRPGPLLKPRAEQRAGYVPNVVYSCGGLVQDRTLLLPYAIADTYCAFATMSVDTLLASLE